MKDESNAPNQSPEFVGGVNKSSTDVTTKEVVALTDNIASLETSLAKEKDERLEERFRWVCATAILFDVVAVSALNGSWLFLPIFMLQLIVLIGFAKEYGVDWAEQLIGRLLHWTSQWNKNN